VQDRRRTKVDRYAKPLVIPRQNSPASGQVFLRVFFFVCVYRVGSTGEKHKMERQGASERARWPG
jgi:hypothetical protein